MLELDTANSHAHNALSTIFVTSLYNSKCCSRRLHLSMASTLNWISETMQRKNYGAPDAQASKLWAEIRAAGQEMLSGRFRESKQVAIDTNLLEDVLRLESLEGPFWIRPSYEQVYIIFERELEKRVSDKEKNFLLLGSPGIGKSFC